MTHSTNSNGPVPAGVPLEVGAALLRGLGRDHHAGAVGERRQQGRVGPLQVSLIVCSSTTSTESMLASLALADDFGVRLHPVEVELGGLRVEVGAVVELHASPQLEDERLGIGLLPRLGQAGLDPELHVEGDGGS